MGEATIALRAENSVRTESVNEA